MLASISPVGEAARHQRWATTAAAYLVGSLAGGAAIGAVLGGAGQLAASAAGPLPAAAALGMLAVLAVVGVAADVAMPGRAPSWRRQVDERWLTTYRGWVYGIGFGFQLGLGVATIVVATVTYLALAAAVLTASVAAGALVGAAFGAARALPLLLTLRIRTPVALRALHRRLDLAARPVARATTGLQLATGVAAAALAIGVAP